MKTTHLAFILTAALATHTYGGDAKVTLSSTDGSSAFIVRNSATDARQTKSVAYSEVIPVLVEAIKQLKAENDALKAQNAIILKRLDALEAK